MLNIYFLGSKRQTSRATNTKWSGKKIPKSK